MSKNLHVDVHILQTVPPSNLNRDDAGTPKQAVYGGVRRARVSSQAWKRATRLAFSEHIPEADRATRTRRVSWLVTERIQRRTGLDREQSARLSTHLLEPLKISPGRKEAETAYLLFLGRQQLDAIVDLVADQADALAALDDNALKAELKELPVRQLLIEGHPVDVALFGRMVADVPGLNVDAACQVAHAISTHPVEVEFDYFTAVDDELGDAETGAGMIGNVEFNSATLYRYATLAFPQLLRNLGEDHGAAVAAADWFIDGFARSMPTGKQNSFAHRTLPSLVAVCVREDQPVNLVSAFEEPVRSTSGLLIQSVDRLASEFMQASRLWGGSPTLVVATYAESSGSTGAAREVFGESVSFPELRERVAAHITAWAEASRS